MNGLPAIANNLASRGRYGDSMLVHMNPKEVGGLQSLARAHGTSMTINPDTGLPEAFKLSSILPMVAGAALAATGVGAPMAALLVGGGYGLATGSLEKGLMAGLGAFGGAGLGGALSAAGTAGAAGAQPLVSAATPTAAGFGATAAPTAVSTAAPSLGSMGISNIAASPLAGSALTAPASSFAGLGGTAAGAAPMSFQAALPGLGVQTAASAAPMSLAPASSTAALQTAAAGAPQTFGGQLGQMGTGLSNVIEGTPGARDAFMQSIGGTSGLIKSGGAAAAPIAASLYEEPNQEFGGEAKQTYIRPYAFDMGRQDAGEGFQYRTGTPGESTSELTYFTPKFSPMGVFKAGEEPGGSFYGTPTAQDYARYASPINTEEEKRRLGLLGGLSGLSGFAGGGITALKKGGNLPPRYLEGSGDGMSDSIKARIGGLQEARLADGEFVIPADVVSHLGNGSSNAGAKKLHAMMDRIRKARTGKERQAPEVKTGRFMPA